MATNGPETNTMGHTKDLFHAIQTILESRRASGHAGSVGNGQEVNDGILLDKEKN